MSLMLPYSYWRFNTEFSRFVWHCIYIEQQLGALTSHHGGQGPGPGSEEAAHDGCLLSASSLTEVVFHYCFRGQWCWDLYLLVLLSVRLWVRIHPRKS